MGSRAVTVSSAQSPARKVATKKAAASKRVSTAKAADNVSEAKTGTKKPAPARKTAAKSGIVAKKAIPNRKSSSSSGGAKKAVAHKRAVTRAPRKGVERLTEVSIDARPVGVTQFRTEVLIGYLGSVTKVADLLGVDKAQPTRWRSGDAVPSLDKARLLNDVEHVFSRAALIFTPAVVRDWMTGANSYLDGARPIDVLRDRGAVEVLAALDAAEQLAFG